MSEVLAGKVGMDAGDHSAPPAGLNHAKNRDQQRAEPDQKELQDFIEDGREQSAGRNVHAHCQR